MLSVHCANEPLRQALICTGQTPCSLEHYYLVRGCRAYDQHTGVVITHAGDGSSTSALCDDSGSLCDGYTRHCAVQPRQQHRTVHLQQLPALRRLHQTLRAARHHSRQHAGHTAGTNDLYKFINRRSNFINRLLYKNSY